MNTWTIVVTLNMVSSVLLMRTLYILVFTQTEDYVLDSSCVLLNAFDDDNGDLCSNQTYYDFVIIVMSASRNAHRRKAIRESWGDVNHYRTLSLRAKVLFVLATDNLNDHALQRTIYREMTEYRDILAVRVAESYSNLIFKHMFALHYVTQHCSQAAMVIKTDDDVFVDAELTQYLYSIHYHDKGPLWCHVLSGKPVRGAHNTLYIDSNTPNTSLSNFCMGSFYVSKMESLQAMAEIMQCYPYSWIDDVHITGSLRRVAGVPIAPLANGSQLIISKDIPHNVFSEWALNSKMRMVYHHNVSPAMMTTLWKIHKDRAGKLYGPPID